MLSCLAASVNVVSSLFSPGLWLRLAFPTSPPPWSFRFGFVHAATYSWRSDGVTLGGERSSALLASSLRTRRWTVSVLSEPNLEARDSTWLARVLGPRECWEKPWTNSWRLHIIQSGIIWYGVCSWKLKEHVINYFRTERRCFVVHT